MWATPYFIGTLHAFAYTVITEKGSGALHDFATIRRWSDLAEHSVASAPGFGIILICESKYDFAIR